jgi:cytoplasmic iron level regulating protein YaaA (DUF328/UPF0246 family)
VRILLPPSEAKNRGGRGTPLSSRKRTAPIDGIRQQTFAALAELVRAPDAATSLLLPPSVVAEAIADNTRAGISRTMPALDRYAGTVYDGLAVRQLSAAARTLAERSILIFSGLFGVVRGGEPVPAYRVPAKAVLPGLGIAGTFWKPHLTALLPDLLDNELVLDLRSIDYASMWQPHRQDPVAQRLLTVRVLSRTPGGGLGVISYPSKLGKGKLAAAVLERRAAGHSIASVADVVQAWLAAGGRDAHERESKTGVAVDLVD